MTDDLFLLFEFLLINDDQKPLLGAEDEKIAELNHTRIPQYSLDFLLLKLLPLAVVDYLILEKALPLVAYFDQKGGIVLLAFVELENQVFLLLDLGVQEGDLGLYD